MSRRPRPIPVPAGGFREIAVLRLSSLGDVVLTLPVVHALARAFPGAKVHYWTKEEYADVVRHDPAIHHVRVLERDARRIEDLVSMSAELETCDLIVDLHASLRTAVLCFRQKAPILRVERQRLRRAQWVKARWTRPMAVDPAMVRAARTLRAIGVEVVGVPELRVPAEAEAWARSETATAGRWIAFCPGARHWTKRWPEEHWVALLERVLTRGFAVTIFTGPKERAMFGALESAAREKADVRWCEEPLPRMAALLGRAAAVVTCDSGLMHVAAARGAKVVAMFGSTSPVLGFAPAGAGHVVLCRNEPCQPCTLHGRERCPLGHFRCLRELKPGEVEAALDRLVSAAAP